jgi:tight adherence protein B
MTHRSSSRRGRLFRRLGLGLGLIILGCLATAAVAGAAPGDLTLALSSLDLSKYPQASVVLQLGGASALTGDIGQDAVTVQVDGSTVPLSSIQAAGQGVAIPIQTVLLIDESGSMKGEAITAASAAATSFIDAMREGDTAAVQAFNVQFRTLQSFTADKNALKASLSGLAPQKETALYDALIKALASFGTSSNGSARYVILLSDGGDTASTATLEQAVTAVRSSGIPVYVIGLKSTEFDSKPLAGLAEAARSRYLETPDPGALISLYQGLAKELHNQYVLNFRLPGAASTSGVGDLVVRVDAGGTVVQAEQGFFYPTAATTTATAAATGTTALTTSTTVISPTVVSGNGLLDRFLRWKASDYIMGVVVFLLVLVVLYVLSGVLFPKRDVLAEYGDLIDRKDILQPRALDEDKPKPNAANRAAGRMLALRGYQEPLQRLIDESALKFRASEFAILQVIVVVVVVVIAKLLGAPLLLVLIIALVLIVTPLLWLSSKGNARRQAFNDQVPNTLMLLAGALKAGQGFEQALSVAANESPEPTASEFQRVLAQLRLGVPPEDTLRDLAQRMRSEAFEWAVMSTVIQRQLGGNLAEIYESTAYTLRERATLRRQIKTLTAEAKLSAIILIILPFAIGGMIGIVNRGYLAPLFNTSMGNAMLGLAAVLMVVGIIWMRAIIRLDK